MTSPYSKPVASVGQKLCKAIPNFLMASATCPLVGELTKPKSNPHEIMPCPLRRERMLYSLIVHLNDEHAASREFIADWLETLDVDLSFRIKDE